ncbi:MAG: hypothetical protein ACHQQR_10110, partial [Gemmatimonadales bacterium]
MMRRPFARGLLTFSFCAASLLTPCYATLAVGTSSAAGAVGAGAGAGVATGAGIGAPTMPTGVVLPVATPGL